MALSEETLRGTLLRSFLYGAGVTLLAVDIFFLGQSLFSSNFVPILPILAGALTATGLLVIIYAESRAREQARKEHRRLARVSHQLEYPLKALGDNLEQLQNKAKNLPADARIKIKSMGTNTEVLLDNVRDVFLTIQAQEGRISENIRKYNVCAIVEEVIEEQKAQAAARNVELLHKLHCDEAVVAVDKKLVKLALTHLVDNAVHYTVTPGLTNIVVIKGDKFVRIVVQDRGIGIPADDAEAVFEPFMRGKQAERYQPHGIGVGLTLARLIVREFGGKLTWRPKAQGMGSEFEIRLPLAK